MAELKVEYARLLKALVAWVERGVLKVAQKNLYILLEVADEATSVDPKSGRKHGKC